MDISQVDEDTLHDEEEKKSVQNNNIRKSLLLRQSSLLSQNEIKLLFKPYTREDL